MRTGRIASLPRSSTYQSIAPPLARILANIRPCRGGHRRRAAARAAAGSATAILAARRRRRRRGRSGGAAGAAAAPRRRRVLRGPPPPFGVAALAVRARHVDPRPPAAAIRFARISAIIASVGRNRSAALGTSSTSLRRRR